MNKRPQYDHRGDRQRALVSKIVPSDRSPASYDKHGNRRLSQANMPLLDQISDQTASTISDIESMYQLLPDIELASQILVSSILSPKDLSVPMLRFECVSMSVSPGAAAKLLEVLEEYFVKDYKINATLSRLINEALIKKGSVPRMIIPESSLDQIINDQGPVTLESVQPYRSNEAGRFVVPILGLLSSASDENFTLESMFDAGSEPTEYDPILSMSLESSDGRRSAKKTDLITLTDNPEVLRIPGLIEKMRKDRTHRVMRERYVTLESVSNKVKEEEKDAERTEKNEKDGMPFAGMSDREIEYKLQSNRKHENKMILEIRDKHQVDRKMRGHPMDMELPSECVIPAYVPGSPSEHIGYYVALDHYGYPLNSSVIDDHYRQLQTNFKKGSNGNENTLSSVVRELRGTYSGGDTTNPVESIMQATDQFADIVEKNLLQRIRGGTGNMGAMLGRPTHLYQIMLARTAAKKNTQLLYVPAELMSYLAFYHNHNGVGRSILENTRVLGGIRVLLMFSNAVNHVRNATPRTELGIDLDPNDTDPYGTISMVRNAFLRSRSEGFPLGEGRPDAALNYLHRAGVDVVYNGHEDLPEMKIETRDASSNRPIFDDRIEEDYRERHIMAFGISPETVDASKRVDFATTIVNSSLLLSKRVMTYQLTFEEKQADFIRKYTNNSEVLLRRLLQTANSLDENDTQGMSGEDIVEQFLADFIVSLPKPDSATLRSKMEAFQEYERAVNDAIENFISDEMAIMDADGDMGRNLREYRAAWKSMLIREYMRENDILPEIQAKLDKDTDGVPMFDFAKAHGDHMDAVMDTMRDYIAKASTKRAKREAYVRAEEERIEETVEKYIKKVYGKDEEVKEGEGGDSGDDAGGDDSQGGEETPASGGDEDAGGEDPGEAEGDEDLDEGLFADAPYDAGGEGGDDAPEDTGGEDPGEAEGDEDLDADEGAPGDEEAPPEAPEADAPEDTGDEDPGEAEGDEDLDTDEEAPPEAPEADAPADTGDEDPGEDEGDDELEEEPEEGEDTEGEEEASEGEGEEEEPEPEEDEGEEEAPEPEPEEGEGEEESPAAEGEDTPEETGSEEGGDPITDIEPEASDPDEEDEDEDDTTPPGGS